MNHVLITGGAGFIGSHLCDAFLTQGFAVTALDNLVTGRMENLEEANQHPAFNFVKHDISKPLSDRQLPLIAKHGLAGVLHFACPASPVDFDKIPIEILKVDSLGTIHTVDLALAHQSRYILASTSEVYGDPLVHPQTETYWGNVNPIGPRACYDEAKRFAEAYVSTSARFLNLKSGIVRIFNTYGPRMRLDDGRVVPELCRQGLKGEALTVHGTGEQTRSFCYVDDLVDGIIRLYKRDIKGPVNLGNPVERKILDFAKRVQELTENTIPLRHLPARADDPKRRCPNITLAREQLGWEPRIDLDKGLELSLEYFREIL